MARSKKARLVEKWAATSDEGARRMAWDGVDRGRADVVTPFWRSTTNAVTDNGPVVLSRP